MLDTLHDVQAHQPEQPAHRQARCLAPYASMLVFAAVTFTTAPAAAAVLTAAMAAVAGAEAFMGGKYASRGRIAPNAIGSFGTGAWHRPTTANKGHSQRERCT